MRDDGLAIANSSVTYRAHARQESGASSIRRKNSARLRLRRRVASRPTPSRNLLDRSFLNASEEIFGSIVVGRLSRKLCFPLPVLLFSSPPPLWNPPREYFSLRKFDVRVDPFNGFILAGLENTLRDLDDSEIGEKERKREIPCGE